jgi:hypothetical protein
MEKVEAWKTVDGKLFDIDKKDIAESHDVDAQKDIDLDLTFKNNYKFIQNYIFENLKEDLSDSDIEKTDIVAYHEGIWGWECSGKGNPIDRCVYSHQLFYGDDGCIFCGEPEERK